MRCNKSIQNINAHSHAVTSISFHPSKQYLVSCSLDSTVKIWDLFNNSILYTLYGHEGPIYSVSFNKIGEFICSGGIDANLLLWRNNLDGKLIPNDIQIMGGLAYPESKKIPKNKSKVKNKYHLRSNSSNKFSVKTRSTNTTDYPHSNIDANILDNNVNLVKKDRNSQSISKNMEIISTNIDSKDIKKNNLNFSNEASKNIENIKNKLDFATKTMLNMSQRINFLEKKLTDLYNYPKNDYNNNFNNIEIKNNNIENGNEEEYGNPEELKEAMDYYQNVIQKNGNNNDNPVEIFEDVNNHVEDIRQEVINNKNKNINKKEIV